MTAGRRWGWYSGPRYRELSGEAFKLYVWLRAQLEEDAPERAQEAQRLRAQGYLAIAASSERIRAEVLHVSRSTLVRVVQELRAAGLCAVQPYRRGYIFVLGEWLVRASPHTGQPVYLHGYYADGLPPHAPSGTEGGEDGNAAPSGAGD
jgi:biotin operon repressor